MHTDRDLIGVIGNNELSNKLIEGRIFSKTISDRTISKGSDYGD